VVVGRARAVMAATAAVLVVVACGDRRTSPEDDPTGAGPSAPADPGATASPASASPTLSAENVMDPIGPRTGEVANPDILITSAETLDADVVEAITSLEGVRSVEQLSMAQVVIESESYTLAAVDPATYRNYTPLGVADSQAVWDRIAGGELGLRAKLARKIPKDENDFVRLGSAEGARAIHIGAVADTVAEVDFVVNETWTDDLGMVEGNALLVRTGAVAPQTLREPIERLAGADAAVAMIDAIALNGLDPKVEQVAVTTGTVADVVGVFRYTVLGGGRIAPEQAWVDTHIATQQVPILGTVTCNRFLFPQLVAALTEIQDRGLADEINPDEYAGCYYPRFIAGSTKLSNHSFGLALDLNVPGNQRGTVGEMDRTVVSIFKKWGFGWGGDWSYTDPMHFEMNRLVNPQ
jgi:hypothetical protein